MRTLCLLLFSAFLLISCRPAQSPADGLARPTTVPRTPTPLPATDEEAILQLLRAESEGVVQQDMTRLAEIWAEDATVTDAQHTPDDATDDAVWRGIDAVLDRYVVLVFPGNPQFAEPSDTIVDISGDEATVRSTTQIGSEISPGGDLWRFVRRDGRWQIRALTYNLEKSP